MGDIIKDDVIEIGGSEFKRVKNGLDESQVASFIDKLISERDKLAQSNYHVTSLNRLAEKTIAEADKLAEQIKAEAAEQVKTERADIINKAQEEAQKAADEKLTEAEKAAALLSEKEKTRTQYELSNSVKKQLSNLQEKLESLKHQVEASKVDFEKKLFESMEKSNSTVTTEDKLNGELHDKIQTLDKTEKTPELPNIPRGEDQVGLGKPQWEIEILPPVDMLKMMDFVNHLDQVSEVINTEIIPKDDAPSILVFMRKSVNLIDLLKIIPNVAHSEEIATGENTANSEPKKVRLGLSKNTNG